MTLTEEQIKEIAEKHSSNDYVRSIAERCIREALELAEKENAEALRSHEAMKALEGASENWINVDDRLPAKMDFYICQMDAEPDMGPRIDVVFYAIKGPGSMAIKSTGWGKPVIYAWATERVLYWQPFPKSPDCTVPKGEKI